LNFSPSTETEPMILSDDKFATVAYLRIKAAKLDDKPITAEFGVPTPPLLTPTYEAIAAKIHTALSTNLTLSIPEVRPEAPASTSAGPTIRRVGRWLAVGNVLAPAQDGNNLSLEQEVLKCFKILEGKLQIRYMLM